jgi:hypothetical protein
MGMFVWLVFEDLDHLPVTLFLPNMPGTLEI